jgi:hypothetical protein
VITAPRGHFAAWSEYVCGDSHRQVLRKSDTSELIKLLKVRFSPLHSQLSRSHRIRNRIRDAASGGVPACCARTVWPGLQRGAHASEKSDS